MSLNSFSSSNTFFISRIKAAIADIFHNGSAKEEGILQHYTNLLTDRLNLKALNIKTINQYLSIIRIIKAGKKVYNCCFSGSCWTNNSNACSRSNCKVYILKNRISRLIAEVYVVKRNVSADWR